MPRKIGEAAVFDKRLIALAVVLRLVCLFLPYRWSDDPYRYWWEGRVQNAGFNPYRHAPDSPALESLRDANWQHVSHKEVPTVYGPVLLGTFRLAALTGLGPVIFKWIFTACDVALCVWLLRWYGHRAWLWVLSPLVIGEFGWNGHEMSLAILLFMIGLRRNSPLAFALAILTHLLALPLVAAVSLRNRDWRFWAILVGVVIAGYAPFAGVHLLTGLTHFAGRWRFNDALFGLLTGLVDEGTRRQVGGDVWFAFERAKVIAAVIVAASLAWVWWRRYTPARAALTVGGVILFFSPVVHPWYVTWLVAFACVEFRWWPIVWSGTVLLSYAGDSLAWRLGEYVPVFATLTWEWYRASIRPRWSQKNL